MKDVITDPTKNKQTINHYNNINVHLTTVALEKDSDESVNASRYRSAVQINSGNVNSHYTVFT